MSTQEMERKIKIEIQIAYCHLTTFDSNNSAVLQLYNDHGSKIKPCQSLSSYVKTLSIFRSHSIVVRGKHQSEVTSLSKVNGLSFHFDFCLLTVHVHTRTIRVSNIEIHIQKLFYIIRITNRMGKGTKQKYSK